MSAPSARLSVHRLFTSCIRRGLVSRDSIVDGDWLHATEWYQRCMPCCQPASDVAENVGKFLVRNELIPTVKMETRNPVEGCFGREFLAICNRGVMAAWCRKTLKNFWRIFLCFLLKRPLTEKLSKFCSKSFHRDTDRLVVFKFREILPKGNLWNRALLTWQKSKILPGSPAVATAQIAPKICQGQSPIMYSERSRFHLNRFTFGGVIAECVKTAKMVNPVFGWSLASSRIIR